MTALNEACTPKPSAFDDDLWLGLVRKLGDCAGAGSMAIQRQLAQWVTDGHPLFEAQRVHTPADRVKTIAMGYQLCVEAGRGAPRALWVVEKGCGYLAKARKETGLKTFGPKPPELPAYVPPVAPKLTDEDRARGREAFGGPL